MIDDTTISDHQLVLNAQNDDFEAYRMIVIRYSNALLSVAYGVLGDFHEAQDVTQEALVKAYNRLHTLNDPSQVGSWLHSITYRTSLDFIKKRKTTLPYSEIMDSARDDDIHLWLDQYTMKESINNALQTLDENNKTAVVLYYLSDWTMKEISDFLNLSVSAVESRIRRAKEKLKHFLSEDFDSYFLPHRLGRDFEQTVCEQILKKMGHFYIPVTNKIRTTDWFISHFHLRRSTHGNLLLESDHELYLLECSKHTPTKVPVLTFSVSNIDDLQSQLYNSGVRTEPIQTSELFGKSFAFHDPDENKFLAVENK
ncbi:sigma-70 family RNA polymerase sigma factor [Chengkuizengella axinellae]|uniref:RNA polymerase sigma factor n=1 Tax=Chengkuizengella axinellae TaxID=3064388 RepID=A0ABT9IZU2_9BACL|nr:sigma-70 family RNA polymerase sigma factor [Chengkuizengella sp. 2205SS18-9]MDP5274883.1 sigma-70 family RNA polymerase sigma factor [Chengkuizengella sp. 2205SS18-9]